MQLMLLYLAAIICGYFCSSFAGYWLHRGLHSRHFGEFHTSHMAHHQKLYPANNFESIFYRNAGDDSTVWFYLWATMPLILTPLYLSSIGIIGWSVGLLFIGTEVIIGLLNNYLHDSYHLTNHWLGRSRVWKWFLKMRTLHREHHIDMNSNFGIFSFGWDKIFKTYSK